MSNLNNFKVLFEIEGDYITEVSFESKRGEKKHLFIEGLNYEKGLPKKFNVNKINDILVEIDGEENISQFNNWGLNTSIYAVIEYAREYLEMQFRSENLLNLKERKKQ